MKKLRSHLGAKLLAVVLCIAVGTVTLWGGIHTLRHWDGLFGRGYFDSGDYYDTLYSYRDTVINLLSLTVQTDGEPSYLLQQQMDAMAQQLKAGNTNFRFVVRNTESGEMLFSNTDGTALADLSGVGTTHMSFNTIYETGPSASDGENLTASMLPGGVSIPGDVLVEFTTLEPLVYDDLFLEGYNNYEPGNPLWMWTACAGLAVMLALTIFLGWTAGHKKGVEGVHRNWQDVIPYDLYLFLLFWLEFGCIFLMSVSYEAYFYEAIQNGAVLLLASTMLAIGLALAAVLTTVTRIKSRTLFRNTLIWRICAFIGKGCQKALATLPMVWRFALGFVLFLLINAFLSLGLYRSYEYGWYLLLLLAFNGFVLWCGCRWVAQWKRIRAGTVLIVGGDPDAQIDTDQMFPDLKAHADQLNDLGTAVNKAVDERMKSERFKAELITNVSHDLKTPLTSIINYVDLLKKADIPNEQAQEYLEVLDRKSQRLKKLTEDLVEASKASTGALTVNRERLGLSQLISQATAEYGEKLAANQLTIVTDLPEDELYVWADGRHLWRILDNLLSNCCKYAMPGTRVYLDAEARGERAAVTVKNVSKDPLNVPASQLLERFVRGDTSRTTEGSGLGLSIAQSLTELQGGTFSLTIDGDFFKAEVTLPRAGALTRDAVL